MQSLLKVFLPYGFKVRFLNQEEKIPFNFEEKKLTAIWLKHPNPEMPRIFISNCRLDEFPELNDTIQPYLNKKKDIVDDLNYKDTNAVIEYLHTPLWPTPSYKDYKKIDTHSEYLAWVFFNKYYLNHFTLSINKLTSFGYQKGMNSILNTFKNKEAKSTFNTALKERYKQIMMSFNHYLKENGLVMNTSKGKDLNISPDQLLLQSSTKAQMIEGEFPDGIYSVPGSYVEFAYRGILDHVALDILKGKRTITSLNESDLKEGFEIGNADKIFESTYLRESQNNRALNRNSFIKSRELLLNFLDLYQHEHPELQIRPSLL